MTTALIQDLQKILKEHRLALIDVDTETGCAYDDIQTVIGEIERHEEIIAENASFDPQRHWGTWNKRQLGVRHD